MPGSLGRPSTRSPTMFFMTSSVPPATCMPGMPSTQLAPGVGAPLAGVGDQRGPSTSATKFAVRRHVVGERQLGDRHLRAGQLAGLDLVGGALVVVLGDLEVDVHVGQLLADERVVVQPEVADHLGQPGDVARPPPPPPPPPIEARSFISVVSATVQPWFTSPRRWSSGTRTSVKNTSLNVAPPVIWRSGRISTPGAFMSTTKPVRPLCLGRSGSVRADDLADVAVVRAGGPHLLAGDDPLVAVALGPGLQAGQVGAGAGLAEQLAADEVAAVQLRAGTGPWPRSVAWARIVGATMPRPMAKTLMFGVSYLASSWV